jgi:hypothetical protein
LGRSRVTLELSVRPRTRPVGDYEMPANFSWGGMPYELVYEQLKLFADKVLPDLKG